MPKAPSGFRRALSRIGELFSIDLRSLAVFRIGLGALLLVDLAYRARLLEAHYTDAGVLPRAILPALPRYSLHTLSGGVALQVVLFTLAAAFAAMLLVGVFTRIATIASWLLLISLHYRNPFLLDGGDTLLLQLLLWSLFLPLGERWSIDARRRGMPADRTAVLSAASVALLLQFVYFYVSTGAAKTGPEWSEEGTALQMALSQTYWSRPLGQALRSSPELLGALTPVVVHFETYAPFLMFVPWFMGPLRMLTILAFAALMGGLGATIQLHLFPFAGMLVALPFLPTWFWKRVRASPAGEGVRYRPRRSEWIAAIVVVPLILHAVYLNLLTHGKVAPFVSILRAGEPLGIHQDWLMYAPSPPAYDMDFRAVGKLHDGSTRNLIDSPDGDLWPPARPMRVDYRFKYYIERLIRPDAAGGVPGPRIQAYLEWICRKWIETHEGGQRLAELSLVFRPTNIDPHPKFEFPEQLLLGQVRCR